MASPKTKKIVKILKEQSELIAPSACELADLKKQTEELLDILGSNIKKAKISAETFVGGSFAKNTLIKKDKYDVDIFVRFDSKKYDDKEISKLLSKIMPKSAEKVHGSRDYFKIKNSGVHFEVIPVLRIKKPEEAKNITDLSYFHVNYIENQIKKSKKLADEIRLAKAFAYFQNCYGAESYISGFSGYAVELLVVCYKRFLKFAEAVAKSNVEKEKIILDPEKKFKNKQDILRELNESKLISPIVLIDPTYKERNALAALSLTTFLRFREACVKFLKYPNAEFFEHKDEIGILERKFGDKLIKLNIKTDRQSGDIAGTKLKKFSGFIVREIKRYFNVKDFFFSYNEPNNLGELYLALEPKKELLYSGPPIKMKEALAKFKKEHKKIKIKAGKAYALEKNSIDFKRFLHNFLNEKSKFIGDMSILSVEMG